MPHRVCPICSSSTNPAGVKRGSRTNREFTLRRCGQCGFVFVEEPWTDYAQIYDEAYYRGAGADPLIDYAFEFEHPAVTVRQYEWRGWDRMIRQQRPSAAKWLDFGCGCGSLVRYLRSRGRDRVYGYDTGIWADKARQAGVPVLREDELAAHEGTFDVVTAIDVIEHVTAPLEMLKRVRRLLQRAGLLVIVTQNAEVAPKDFASWPYVIPEIHVSYFTPRALTLALQQSGFAPFHLERTAGWSGIIRSRILKNMRVSRMNCLEKLLPWRLLTSLADARYKMNAHPAGRAA